MVLCLRPIIVYPAPPPRGPRSTSETVTRGHAEASAAEKTHPQGEMCKPLGWAQREEGPAHSSPVRSGETPGDSPHRNIFRRSHERTKPAECLLDSRGAGVLFPQGKMKYKYIYDRF